MSQGRSRRTFTTEFKVEAVGLSRRPGMTVKRTAADLGVGENVLRRWRRELAEGGDDAFRGNGRLRAADKEDVVAKAERLVLRRETLASVESLDHPGAVDG